MGAESISYSLTPAAQAMNLKGFTTKFAGCPMAEGPAFDVMAALAASGGSSFTVCDNAIKQALDTEPLLQKTPAGQFFYLPAGADSNANTTCNCITADASNNFLLGGSLAVAGVGYEAVLRVTPTLAVDTTFGVNGWWLMAPVGSTSVPEIQGIAVVAGKIAVAGGINTISGQRSTAARINSNGTPDTGFNTTGMVVFNPNGCSTSLGLGSAIQADGKIIICGTAIRISDGVKVQFATRFLTTGAVDTGYGTSGSVLTDLGEPAGSAAWGIKLDSGGLAVLGGEAVHNASTTTAGANPAGALVLNATTVAGMQPGMVLTIGPAGPTQDQVFAQAPNSGTQTQIFPALAHTHAPGEAVTWSFDQLTAVRITTAGVLDTTFNTVGYSKNVFGVTAVGLALAIQSDGKIIVSGGTISSLGVPGTVNVRLATNGTVDTGYGTSGFGFLSGPSINGILIDPSDRLVVADNPGTLDELCMRALIGGGLDPAFATAGRFSQIPKAMVPNGVAINGSGDLCLGGVGVPVGGLQSFAALRLNSSGGEYQ